MKMTPRRFLHPVAIMAGVVQVHVGAAGDALGEAEVTLRAISKEEARCLQRCVEQAKHKVGAAAHPENHPRTVHIVLCLPYRRKK